MITPHFRSLFVFNFTYHYKCSDKTRHDHNHCGTHRLHCPWGSAVHYMVSHSPPPSTPLGSQYTPASVLWCYTHPYCYSLKDNPGPHIQCFSILENNKIKFYHQ